MKKFLMLFTILVLSAQAAFGQIVIKGPTNADPGTLQSVSIDLLGGTDLKILAFNGGLPLTQNWKLIKELDNSFGIMYFPQKGDTRYTFVVSANKEGKTFLAFYNVEINGAPKEPIKPDVKPVEPVKVNRFSDAYNKAQDKAQLNKMIAMFEEVLTLKFNTYGDLEKVIITSANKELSNTALLPLREAISIEMTNALGTNPLKIDVEAAKKTIAAIVADLKQL